MNRLLKYLPLLFICLGCSDFLDSESYDKKDSKDFYNNAEDINAAVLACYNGIHNTLKYEYYLTEIRSDNSRNYRQQQTGGTGLEQVHLDIFRVDPSNTLNNYYWEAAYHNIANCNTVLKYIDKVEVPELRLQYEAEARFIRAYHYFNLVRLYGPVFLVTERITHQEAKQYERSSIDDVYAQIVEDLDFATDLPVSYDEDQLGRVDRWAAKTMLAKVYLTRYGTNNDKDLLQLAKDLLEDVEKNSGYRLVKEKGSAASAYANLFSTDNEMNEEMIFVSRYLAGGKGLGSPFANAFAPASSQDAIIYGSGSGDNCPTDELIAAYELEPKDTRKDAVLSATWIDKYKNDAITHVAWVKKYWSNVTMRYDAENDWPILRFADVLLMLGEIENEQNGPTQAALDYLNTTRERAGLDKLDPAPASRDAYRLAMLHERRLEFAFENQRLFDLLRSGRIVEIMEKHYSVETLRNTTNGKTSVYYDNASYNTYIAPQERALQNWQLLLPIPYLVMISAPNATQNNGY